jgi:Holliday junction resolvase-like predicted endonuclease
MKILKSSRHSKITGDFAEQLVLYWLSKHGFECALVDHTGLDIIARNPANKELMGISVKSRSRNAGTETSVLRIDAKQVPSLDFACGAFGCKPYFAIVVDAADLITAWIVPRRRLLKLCEWKPSHHIYWKMGANRVRQYATDPAIMSFQFSTKTLNWWA